ncbi:MAG: ATP--guanido phosphotransferase [Clostridia bacterium]|nr:ATP--guanido phosphotransferase [Clostridia bacterium]
MAWQHEWIEETVISTRIRLARNFSAYPFPKKMTDAQASDLVYLLERGLEDLDNFKKYEIGLLKEDEATMLQEQYLISPALRKNKRGAAFVTEDRAISIMVNEEDHIRQQYFFKGFDLWKAYERISAVDDGLGSQFDFAFDERLGYLTSCPSNLGTGMRASVMMFLPGLVWNGELKKMLPSLKAGGFTVRGAFGEGSTAEGHVYQISNQKTLGVSEISLITDMHRTALMVSKREIMARASMLEEAETEIKDRCLRAYGVLTNCVLLSQNEFFSKMADVKLGVLLGFLYAEKLEDLQAFINEMRPNGFRIKNGLQKAGEAECDEVRASIAAEYLAVHVRKTDWEEQQERKFLLQNAARQ